MSNQPTIEGVVHHIGELEQITDSFAKRQLVVDTGGEYPQQIPVEFFNDKTGVVDKVSVGQTVTVYYNPRGRQAKNGNYYGTFAGWKIEQGDRPTNADIVPDDDDDIPF